MINMKCYMIFNEDGKHHCKGKSKSPAVYFNLGDARRASRLFEGESIIETYEMKLIESEIYP